MYLLPLTLPLKPTTTANSLTTFLIPLRYKDQLRSIFNYYSMTSGPCTSEAVLLMGMSQWMYFCTEAGVVDNSKRGCHVTDLDNIFVAVNFEEDSKSLEADENDDDAMMR